MECATDTGVDAGAASVAPLPRYREILLAVDSSDHANRGVQEGVTLAKAWGSRVTATHVYAAQLHDVRFRQMEGGLPERFREEAELEHQRDVHDSLITRGLSIIADSYFDQVERACSSAGLSLARRALEGKNYRRLVEEANSGRYDLLVLGARGLGAVTGSALGTVCERVVRRASIDTLVIKSAQRSLADGPIVVAIDGSARAYGGLLTALSLAQLWQVPLHVVAAFDPYYHYVAFNRIAGVLSEEAGKVFRFQEQERLHEEIIDSGLAKIYAGHLKIAADIAGDHALRVQTRLLDGKPHDVIARHLRELNPSLLVLGKLGIHADAELEIGGNAEHLLRSAPCAVLLSQRQFVPRLERIAEVTMAWTHEAEQRMQRAPSFVQNMARMAVLRYAQERGHTVITERIVEEATATLMPARAQHMMQAVVAAHDAGEIGGGGVAAMPWSAAANERLQAIAEPSLRDNLRLRAEKKARAERAPQVTLAHLSILGDAAAAAGAPSAQARGPSGAVHWQADALARLMRVPEGFMRDGFRSRVENAARQDQAESVTLERVERELAAARQAMHQGAPAHEASGASTPARSGRCPFSGRSAPAPAPAAAVRGDAVPWTTEAKARLQAVPPGHCRELTQRAVEALVRQLERPQVDLEFVQTVLRTFEDGSRAVAPSMAWTDAARDRIERAPDAVRGMLVKEIEGWAQRQGLAEVDDAVVEAVKGEWQAQGVFHLDPEDARHGA